jgi:hypothetical protein
MALAASHVSAIIAGTLAALGALGCGGSSVRHSGEPEQGQGASAGDDDDAGKPQPSAAAGLSISLTPPLDSELPHGTTRTCPAGSSGAFTYAIGKPAPTKTISNGTQEVGVRCLVMPNADGSFTVDAEINGPDTNTGEFIVFALNGTANLDPARQSLAHVTFAASKVQRLEIIDDFPLCELGPLTVLKAGALLGDFECALLGSTSDTASGCRAYGTLALEYCSTTP